MAIDSKALEQSCVFFPTDQTFPMNSSNRVIKATSYFCVVQGFPIQPECRISSGWQSK